MRGQSSFYVHLTMAAAVTVAAVVLRVSLIEWCVLVLCISTVIGAEMFNTAFESVARAITQEYNDDVRNALDIGSGAVLLMAVGAAAVGSTIFVLRLGVWLGWWGTYLIV